MQIFQDIPQPSSLDIEKLIPHRDRMKLINAILDINDDTAVTSSEVADHWPLREGSFVHPIILIEIVAQTAAVHVSWKKGLDKDAGRMGWLVGVKSADFFGDNIPLHTVLIATVKNLYSAGNYDALEGTVTAGANLLSRIQLQIFHS